MSTALSGPAANFAHVVAAASSDIPSVLARMEAIAAGLPEPDGVGRFNHLYLAVTREVDAQARDAEFEDVDFVVELDVVFAGLYFAAVDADGGGSRLPRAWAPLFGARRSAGIAAIQFALAGMNAHINHDLALALVDTCRHRGVVPERGSPQHRDFERVNAILEAVQERVKGQFAEGLVGVADRLLGRLDDVLAMWKVARARDAAWTHAQTLWALHGLPFLADEYVATLDRMVGFAGRGLLVPVLEM
jgi:hypothetical protein